MQPQKDQLFTILENHVKELRNVLPPGEIEGLILALKMTAEELADQQLKTESVLLKAENHYLKEINERNEALLKWYRRHVRI